MCVILTWQPMSPRLPVYLKTQNSPCCLKANILPYISSKKNSLDHKHSSLLKRDIPTVQTTLSHICLWPSLLGSVPWALFGHGTKGFSLDPLRLHQKFWVSDQKADSPCTVTSSLRHVLLALHRERHTATCQESNTKVFVTLTQRKKKHK